MAMIGPLIKLLPYVAPAIRYADDKNRSYWKLHLVVYTLIVGALDVAVAHTAWAYYMGWPKRKELTISHTLERLYPAGNLDAVRLALAINFVSPGHIKAATK